jgi:hypothetical protein
MPESDPQLEAVRAWVRSRLAWEEFLDRARVDHRWHGLQRELGPVAAAQPSSTDAATSSSK